MNFHAHGKHISITSLTLQFHECEWESQLDNRTLIPQDCIEKIATEHNIEEVLRESGLLNNDLLDFICFKAKKTFLILARMEKLPAITRFKQFGFTDSYLPIAYYYEGSNLLVKSLGIGSEADMVTTEPLSVFREKGSISQPEDIIDFGKGSISQPEDIIEFEKGSISQPEDVIEFEKTQWTFLAPVFKESQYRYKFHPGTILPFRKYGAERDGGFSNVVKIAIHLAHFQSARKETRKEIYWALKHATNSRYDDREKFLKAYDEEAEFLEKIGELRHPHLIGVIATFQREDVLYFIFPWAERGNLREFWVHESPRLDRLQRQELISWILNQLCGLSEAISELYRKNCRHCDLKPENILLFDENQTRGRLVIADVSLTKFHNLNTELRSPNTETLTRTLKYGPPEIFNSMAARSRVYDIWSMGCICLEFLIWFLWGPEDLRTFDSGFRCFWQEDNHAPGKTMARVNDKVISTIDWMVKSDARCQEETALGDILRLVRKRLLVIDIERDDTGDSKPIRAKADEFLREMYRICEKMDEPHYISPCIQPPSEGLSFLSPLVGVEAASDNEADDKGDDEGDAKGDSDKEVMIEMRKSVPGKEHPSTLASRASLASTYRNQGQWREAEELDESDTTSTERHSTIGSDHPHSTNPSSLSQIAMDTEQLANNQSPGIFYTHNTLTIELQSQKRDNDTWSVDSIPDDIDSLAESTSGTGYRQAAITYIGKILTDDTELLALYQEAVHYVDEAKFLENNQRLLKGFFMDLCDENYTPSQKLVIEFFRSRSRRIDISSEIRRLLHSRIGTRGQISLVLKKEQGKFSLLDRYLTDHDPAAEPALMDTVSGTSDQKPTKKHQVKDSEDTDDEEGMSSDESESMMEDNDTLPKLTAAAKFLTSGPPFSRYKENLRTSLLPKHRSTVPWRIVLVDMIYLLKTTLGFCDKPVEPGIVRLHWRCVSN
ncbi:MAG: hypothetical protein M1822_000619 [Bathelium mastoideum]|nr:MAG: hypothetical protein M1822_000619 [Bathelium mastoideum]